MTRGLRRGSLTRLRRGASSDSLIEFVTDRAGHDWRYAIDASKIERIWGLCPTRPLRRVWQKRSTGTSPMRPGGGRSLIERRPLVSSGRFFNSSGR